MAIQKSSGFNHLIYNCILILLVCLLHFERYIWVSTSPVSERSHSVFPSIVKNANSLFVRLPHKLLDYLPVL